MKGVVLCGGLPQAYLLDYLKERGVETVLLDMNENVVARSHADKFYPVSVLDVEAVKKVVVDEKADFLITVCADQVLEVVAQISEDLGLPCYIDADTAHNVSKKSFMKRIFVENGIPTSKHVILAELTEDAIEGLKYPLIVKPVDAYSSRGVKKCASFDELTEGFAEAVRISRTKTAIVEEFVTGDELTVDVWIEDGKANVMVISHLDKIGEDGKFVIHRSRFPAQISGDVRDQIERAAQGIATAFGLTNSPMLIQLITDGRSISVVEFCSRTGGGIKFRHIKKLAGFDVVKGVADLTLGQKPHYEKKDMGVGYVYNQFLYCKEGELDRVEGLEELLRDGVITEFAVFKAPGHKFTQINSSGDRVGYYAIEAPTLEAVEQKCAEANSRVKVIARGGEDILRHDLIAKR